MTAVVMGLLVVGPATGVNARRVYCEDNRDNGTVSRTTMKRQRFPTANCASMS
ncbi:hypothetical protein PR003_g13421 [Phytophthora rubi]|uniref:RxLR effector protein n=1 Tax=Phytophthora rubi TaxID=129364 RepID=A0A6A3KXX8_9STRA|nr:hypothetical protein PR002_g15332 [Phytophthora rubi]KAE9016094.1 hypothetical protein PR001_g14734 [Phytophthora rubi]KAE9334646.1 hypothetical protein PR003_g13421 [Phytophthora rubi]